MTVAIFALSGIASQNVTQIETPLATQNATCRTHVQYKKNKLFDKNIQCHGRWQWIKNAVVRSSILIASIQILLAAWRYRIYKSVGLTYFWFSTRLILNTQHCVSKKVPTFKLSVTLSYLDRFSEFLHCWKAYDICYKSCMALPTSP